MLGLRDDGEIKSPNVVVLVTGCSARCLYYHWSQLSTEIKADILVDEPLLRSLGLSVDALFGVSGEDICESSGPCSYADIQAGKYILA